VSEDLSASEGERKRHALALFAALPDRYDRAGAALSFGQDPRWRHALVKTLDARSTDRVLDVATGTGLVAAELVRRYGCAVVGLDQSPEMLAGAAARLQREKSLAPQVSLVLGEAERLPFADQQFDHLTFTYLLRYVDDPAVVLAELARVVRSGGRIASLEFGVPARALWRAPWRLYTRFGLPAVGALLSREWAQTGRFLSRSIPEFYERYPLQELCRLWEAAGITAVGVRQMSFGAGVVMWGTKR
jgi:demethylmenaquinone methyltransferase / 2-methoxy-6-polyprenyl-1,4-benzoquinol methylase